ncbi:MAG: hypothetical protein ACE5H1_01765 [Thermodesulfobacteriota bacterium]
MARNRELSQAFHDFIRIRYLFFSENSRNIANAINNNDKLTQKYGKTDHSSVEYHISKIKQEIEPLVTEDAIETYQAEFFRTQKAFEQEISELNDLIDIEEDKDLKLKMMRMRHEIRVDNIKHITDARLPLAVAKFKKEREGQRIKKLVMKPDEEEGSNTLFIPQE